MPDHINFENPEPVPSVSQLVALPFVGAVAGYLIDVLRTSHVRVTLHRVMDRDGYSYLQQLCAYGTGTSKLDHLATGRIFASTAGVIGKAFHERKILRTRKLPNKAAWQTAYLADRTALGEMGQGSERVLSYLAIPILDKAGVRAVCVLYAEAGGLNLFVKKQQILHVVAMCHGFCRIVDGLVRSPIARVRNYPLPSGSPFKEAETVYPSLQEAIEDPAPPRFESVSALNFAPAP